MACNGCGENGGLNQVVNLPVPGIDNTTSASVDTSYLVGCKTIQVSGTYSGRYVILGSHTGNDDNFVPLLIFDSGDGLIRQTMCHVMRFLQVRRNATNSGPVTIMLGSMRVSTGLPSQQFIALTNIEAGTQVGPRPSTDLNAVVAPTGLGLEKGFTVVCTGDFSGTIAFEGSMDGITWAPVGENQRGELVGGFTLGTQVETVSSKLSPLNVNEVVRFIRPRVAQGTVIRGAVKITLGGMPNCDCSAGGAGTLAKWDSTLVRYFFVDNETGDDGRAGYIDAAAGTVFTTAQADAVKVKTLTRLMQIFPRFGNGRAAVILVKNRAGGTNYLGPDGATQESWSFAGTASYSLLMRRGSTDLTNSITDRILAGGVIDTAGPNSDQSWTVGAGSTVSTIEVPAGGLPAEPEIIGRRVRFKGNVTAALANVTGFINANTATQITVGVDLGVAPATGDEFFIERPGVRVVSYQDCDLVAIHLSIGSAANPAATTVGIGATGTTSLRTFLIGTNGRTNYAFCETVTATSSGTLSTNFGANTQSSRIAISRLYTDETGTSRAVGSGFRMNGETFVLTATAIITASDIGQTNRLCRFVAHTVQVVGGSYFHSGLSVFVSASGLNSVIGNQGVASERRVRVRGISASTSAVRISGYIGLRGVEITDCTGIPGVRYLPAGDTVSNSAIGTYIIINDVTGSSGNTDVGLDWTLLVHARVDLGRITANTVTGTLGDIRLEGGAITTHTGLTLNSIQDRVNNEFIGTAGVTVGQCVLVTNQAGVALAVGDIVRGNGTSGQVTSAQADAAANAEVLGVMVTPPANGTVGYMAVSGSPLANFTDAAPTPGAIAYLAPGTARQATTTIPPSPPAGNRKLRLGRTIITGANQARVTWHPESLSVAADNLA